MSFEKLQVWLKNFNKFKPALDVDKITQEFIKNLTTFKDLVQENPYTNKDLLTTLLGKMQIWILEFCNEIDVDMDDILKDKVSLLDSASPNP